MHVRFDGFLRKVQFFCDLPIALVLAAAHVEDLPLTGGHQVDQSVDVFRKVAGAHFGFDVVGRFEGCEDGYLETQRVDLFMKAVEDQIARDDEKQSRKIAVGVDAFVNLPQTDEHLLYDVLRILVVFQVEAAETENLIPVGAIETGECVGIALPEAVEHLFCRILKGSLFHRMTCGRYSAFPGG